MPFRASCVPTESWGSYSPKPAPVPWGPWVTLLFPSLLAPQGLGTEPWAASSSLRDRDWDGGEDALGVSEAVTTPVPAPHQYPANVAAGFSLNLIF